MSAIPIVALDTPTEADAIAMARRVSADCRFFKVGSELFTAAGPAVVQALRERGADVFLDLKFHDIPNTVAGAVRSAARLGARLVTVHASGGAAMLQAAVEAAAGVNGGSCGVLAVTVLTSMDEERLAAAWGRRDRLNVLAEVLRLAEVAQRVGAHGIVCSGLEAALVREQHGDALALLVPGVRLAGGAAQDQMRVVTPGAAARAGARYVVLGRTVTGADDPAEAMAMAAAELREP